MSLPQRQQKPAKKRKPKAPASLGRPSVFTEKNVAKILELAARGMIEVDICKKVGICPATLAIWKNKYPDFLDALKIAKAKVDDLVESALLQRALGFSHEAVKIFLNDGKVVTEKYTEQYAPDTTAAIFWLKNRRAKEWRDVHRREHTGSDGRPIEIDAPQPQIVVMLPANGYEAKPEKIKAGD